MRDYKHVKVPRGYRASNRRTATRRVEAAPSRGKRTGSVAGSAVSVLFVLLTAALCYGAWEGYLWLTQAETFQVAGVDVQGAYRVREEEVRSMAALFTGQNIFRVDPDAAVRRARTNPWVASVRVERKLPNRISMVITERTPRAVLHAANGSFLIDLSGTVIIPAVPGDASSRCLAGIALKDLRAVPGEPVTAPALPEAFALLDALAERGGWDLGSVTVRADAPDTIAIVYANREFRIGSGRYDEKLRRLGEIVSDMNRQKLEYTSVELRPERQAAVMVVKDRGKGHGARGKGKKQKG